MREENKKRLVELLFQIVKMTQAGSNIESMELDEKEAYVYIRYENGHQQKICVECDSGIALIRDVVKKIN